jgi:MATE family multidrug resistance protein
MTTRADAITIQRERVPGGVTEVAVLAYPAVLQTLSETLMQVVDSAIVGRLGVTELGAVGFGGLWIWTLLCPFVGTGTGVQTFVAQAYGAEQRSRCGGWVWQGVYAMLPAILLWGVLVAVFFPALLRVLAPSPELQALAVPYAWARLCGAPAVVPAIVFTSFFRGIGDTRTPLLAAAVENLVNIVLCYGLVFGRFGLPAWGVTGAGAAMAIALWVYSGVLAVLLFRRRTRQAFHTQVTAPDRAAIARLLRTGAPIGGQWLLDMISFAIFSTIIARMGDVAIAANQAMIQLLSLSFMQAVGISIASGALVGRYVGARDWDAVERSHRSALKLGFTLAAVVAALFVAMPDTLIGIFTNDPELLRLGRPLLALGALFQLIDAIGIIASGSLRGAGDTRWPFLVQTSLAWLLRLPLVYVVAVALGGGVTGAWLGELGYVTVLGAMWLLRFRSGVWRTIRI